jgi:hypothetical protein
VPGASSALGIACASAGRCRGVGLVTSADGTDGVDFAITGSAPSAAAAAADTTVLDGVAAGGPAGYVEVGARHNGWGYP